LMHRIDGGAELDGFAASTKSSTDAGLIATLHQLGRKHAKSWLGRHFSDLGLKSTVNIKQDYLDDMRMPMRKG